jgi:hypothetical protein
MIMEISKVEVAARPVFGVIEQEDDTNSCTECCADDDEVDEDDIDDSDTEDENEDEIDMNTTNTTANNAMDDMESYVELMIPSNFICPLTLEIMNDPLLSRHGQSYERSAIMEWIHQGNMTCPMTRQPLRLSGLITNHTLKVQIDQWKIQNNYYNQPQSSHQKKSTGSTEKKKKKKKSNQYNSTERILGMYCNFLEETTDRSRDDPPIILEWRRPTSDDEEEDEEDEARNITSTRSTASSSLLSRQRRQRTSNNTTNTNTNTNGIQKFWTRFRSKPPSNTTPTMV